MSNSRDILSKIMRLRIKGDYLRAYDVSIRLSERFPELLGAKFHAVSTLGRFGLCDKAWEHYSSPAWKLDQTDRADLAALAGTLAYYSAFNLVQKRRRKAARASKTASSTPRALQLSVTQSASRLFREAFEQISSVGAYIARQRVWQAGPADRKRRAWRAAKMFVNVYEETEGILSGINAAVMYLVAGDGVTANFTAQRVLQSPENNKKDSESRKPSIISGNEILFARLTGYLLCEDYEDFYKELKRISFEGRAPLWDYGACWRQLEEVCRILSDGEEQNSPPLEACCRAVREAFPAPSIIHYGGHMIAARPKPGRPEQGDFAAIGDEIGRQLKLHRVGAGYGGLACGADIVFAEQLLKRRAELHVVIPFGTGEFIDTSVRRGGKEWIDRFQACYRKATSITYVSDNENMGESPLFAHSSDVAMGMAVWRHKNLDLPLQQLLVWDGQDSPNPGGTAHLYKRWTGSEQLKGHKSCRILKDSSDSPPQTICVHPASASIVSKDSAIGPFIPPGFAPNPPPVISERDIRAIMFADVKGFSKLDESLLPKFRALVMRPLEKVLTDYNRSEGGGNCIEEWNTWGDAFFAIIRTVSQGAECALRLLEKLRKTNLVEAGFPPDMNMRFGMHVGAVFKESDPSGNKKWHGSQVSRTARIEPVATPGQIYVTEPFAAVLALEAYDKYRCDYLGVTSTAKGYGSFRMYRLSRRIPGPTNTSAESS